MEREPTIQIESASRTLRGQAYDILKRQLLSGEWRPVERFNEVFMASRLALSRGPLREAIRNLEQEGLLIAAPHRGTFVRRLTEAEAAELQEVRLVLETAAACRLAHWACGWPRAGSNWVAPVHTARKTFWTTSAASSRSRTILTASEYAAVPYRSYSRANASRSPRPMSASNP